MALIINNMPGTNVELSKNELELVSSSEIILTKNRITEKVYNLFGGLQVGYETILHAYKEILPTEIFSVAPKIYKGENYLNLPYVMMDYPRIFLKEDVFTIRSFFWWGNYFSITLQLSGKYLSAFKKNLQYNLEQGVHDNYFMCVNEDAWQHHFEENNYVPLEHKNIEALLQKSFVKIATKISLSNWNKAPEFFRDNYGRLIQFLVNH